MVLVKVLMRLSNDMGRIIFGNCDILLCDSRSYNDSGFTFADIGDEGNEGTSDSLEDDLYSPTRDGDNYSDSVDYSMEIQTLIEQTDELNENVYNMHETLVICTGFMFCVVVFVMVKVVSTIFNKVLGLGNC